MDLSALKAKRDALKLTTYKLDTEEQEAADLAAEIEAEQKRIDGELAKRLCAEADVAKAKVIASGYKGPIRAIYNVNAWKLSDGHVGWLVMGPTDKGKAVEIMRQGGKYKAGDGLKLLETDPDTFVPALEQAVLASPMHPDYPVKPEDMAKRQQIGRALQDVPEWARAAYGIASELAGGVAEETGKKSSG